MTRPQPQTAERSLLDVAGRDKPVVLHVDDDAASLIMAEGPLLEAGFDVVQGNNGLEAVALFESHSPDLVIMDALMPEMDGYEAIKQIRSTVDGAHVPILMITGLDDLESITRAYDEGATDFLTKPVNFFILPHRVQYMMRAKLTSDALRLSQSQLDNAQRIARLGHWEWNVSNNKASWSRELARLFGLDMQSLHGHWETLLAKIDNDSRNEVRLTAETAAASSAPFSIEFQVYGQRETDSRIVRMEAEPTHVKDGVCTQMQGTVQDITLSRIENKEIRELAYLDHVTGLPNRAQLRESLTQTLNMSARYDSQFALLFLDLDHFKQVNDTLGHDAGDDLLQQVSDRLSSVVRDSDVLSRTVSVEPGEDSADSSAKDTVARIGGDEFVVLLGNINRVEDAARVAQRIAHSISQPYMVTESQVSVTTSIGISVFPSDGSDAETLMKHADIAMYHAKENGRNGYQFYSNDIHQKALARFSMERELREAISGDQLVLCYQPKIDLETGAVTGAEALLRWQHPVKGSISPAEFIPLAEETGLILDLGEWVLNEATRQAQQWIETGLGTFSISVNISEVQMLKGNIISHVQAALSGSGLAPQLLELDLSENLFLNNVDNGIQIINSMKELGVKIALDDFGTGFSSLSDLKRLNVDKLKLPPTFVTNLHTDRGDAAIVSAISTLGRELGMTICAEGVEKDVQLKALKNHQCNEAQGFYFCEPLLADEFEVWIGEFGGSVKQSA